MPEHRLELYKLAVEMADRVSARRAVANSFFLTINTGLVALVGGTTLRWYVAAAGIVFSLAWGLLLSSYRKLNTAKFAVITAMEVDFSRQLFSEEYRLYKGEVVAQGEVGRRARISAWATKYRELGEVERIVPVVFALIYIIELLRQAGV
ncbi:hypothetical protein C7Y72_10570 [Paraconexibacter algicola]|uniref:Uncharacterized protein n=2 Tax=Paraconexibacter algicola TaxID=2133960 RepID=A0A2T4UNI2_9ACTN|nr:hypothetical protein C7Y72_10570 [Paraconexibacter algicola]